MEGDWQGDLERWLEPYLKDLGNATRRQMCPAYIAVLIGPGDRKSIQPIAARVDALSYDRLHHFIGAGLWDSAPLEARLWRQADALVGGDKARLIIDDTALPKKGKASVGVAPQYATALGKNANCQTLVSVTLASGKCRSCWVCGYSCRKAGLAMRPEWPRSACPNAFKSIARSPTSPSRRSRPGCALAASWPMPAMAYRRHSDRRLALGAFAGPSASPAPKRSIPQTCN